MSGTAGSITVTAVREAVQVYVNGYGWREGQSAFNALHEIAPEVANAIRGGHLDPFYNDARLPEFYAYVEAVTS